MAIEQDEQPTTAPNTSQPQAAGKGFGYQPTGQRGYQPQSSKPLDPMKLAPPTGGSAVQPPSNQPVQPSKPAQPKK